MTTKQHVKTVYGREKRKNVWFADVQFDDGERRWIRYAQAVRSGLIDNTTGYIPIMASAMVRMGLSCPPGRYITYAGFAPELEPATMWPKARVAQVNQQFDAKAR